MAEELAAEPSMAVVTTKNFISGIVGGGCEAVVGYPLETVKARMQTQKTSSGRSFSGPIDCLQQSVRDGGMASLYRGATPQIFRSAISASILFGLVGQYRYFYSKYVFEDKPRTALVAAATSTGFTEAILYTPFEIIKVRMQTQYANARTRISNWQCVREVYGQNGIRGLYRGFIPTAQREMLGNSAYFLAYETGKEFLMDILVDNSPHLTPEQEHFRTYQAIAAAGGYAGFMYWLAVFPIDTVKSVMQADRLDKPRYQGVMDCCRKLYQEGGATRFYRGISPSLIRAFPANAITFVAFETCLSFLDKHF
ncbi:hypothetical protein Poli38472_009425 [Pythium oligandrum]|uniref:Mitochondrial carrier protein n=1 Tax=Pythium oligandrum TaxID=41045 RepID=A0A8K1CMY7_PYTOL|nr:hypothetical protein Poli38472_009425 [Pythium oligandrum]|eukprot:TMW65258.1 hypothetical protein Poli38472_009425 [Pythium oligandrum]